MKNNQFKINTLSALCIAAFCNMASAQELTPEEDFEMALLALPELADDIKNPSVNKSAAVRMKCFVDTPAYDLFRYDACFSVGAARTTTAVFRVDNVPAGSSILWSDSNCTANNNTCFVPIRQYQTKNVSATVLKPDGTYSTTSATAHYEGLF